MEDNICAYCRHFEQKKLKGRVVYEGCKHEDTLNINVNMCMCFSKSLTGRIKELLRI